MATETELFINAELPKRPYTNQFPLTVGHVPVATGNGLETEARLLDVSDITNAASEQYVNDAISALIDNSPGALDTLNELAAALGDDPNFASTVSTALSNRLRVDVNTQGLTLTEKQNGLDNLGITEVITDANMNASGLITFTKNTGQTADTVQVPTAISGLSFDANTGILTSSYTNGVANTTITVAANEVADNVFRIKDNTDATKKIAFEASGIATGQVRTITMPDTNVNLGMIGKDSPYIELANSSSNQNLAANSKYSIPRLYTGALALTLPSGAAVGTTVTIADTVSINTDTGSGIDYVASLIVTSDVIQAPTGYVSVDWKIGLSANSYAGSDTMPLTPGGEIVFVRTASNWFVSHRFGKDISTDALIRRRGEVRATTQIQSEVLANTNRIFIFPNKDVNLGDLPSVATTNGNVTTAGARLLKGRDCTLVDNSPCVINGNSIKSGLNTGGAGIARGGAGDYNWLRPGYVNVPLARYTMDTTSGIWAINATGIGGGTIYPMAIVPATNGGSPFLAMHKLTFLISLNPGIWVGVRRIICVRDPSSGAISILSITTEGTDYVSAGVSGQMLNVNLGTTVDPGSPTSYAHLHITATSTTSNSTGMLCQATLESYYSNLG